MVCHDIIALELHARSDDIKRGLTSQPLDSTHSRERRHRRIWTARMVGRHRAWHDITALGQHHTVRLRRVWHDITAFGQHTRSNDVRSVMPSSPLGSTHSRMTSAWHAIIAHGRRTRSNDVERGMPSTPKDSTQGRTTSGVACYKLLWAAQKVGRLLA